MGIVCEDELSRKLKISPEISQILKNRQIKIHILLILVLSLYIFLSSYNLFSPLSTPLFVKFTLLIMAMNILSYSLTLPS